jgi:hypothetical protein
MDTQSTLQTVLIIILVAIGLFVGLAILISTTNENERRKEILSKSDIWGESTCQTLLKKRIEVDMTKEQVRLAWGKPSYTDQQEVTKRGEKVRWVYGAPRKGARYVWFTNDTVTKIKS